MISLQKQIQALLSWALQNLNLFLSLQKWGRNSTLARIHWTLKTSRVVAVESPGPSTSTLSSLVGASTLSSNTTREHEGSNSGRRGVFWDTRGRSLWKVFLGNLDTHFYLTFFFSPLTFTTKQRFTSGDWLVNLPMSLDTMENRKVMAESSRSAWGFAPVSRFCLVPFSFLSFFFEAFIKGTLASFSFKCHCPFSELKQRV